VTQSQLNRSVAHATGETVDLVRHLGFTVLGPMTPDTDKAVRWLRAHQQRPRRHRRQHRRQRCFAR
jgi:hypothetical protein